MNEHHLIPTYIGMYCRYYVVGKAQWGARIHRFEEATRARVNVHSPDAWLAAGHAMMAAIHECDRWWDG